MQILRHWEYKKERPPQTVTRGGQETGWTWRGCPIFAQYMTRPCDCVKTTKSPPSLFCVARQSSETGPAGRYLRPSDGWDAINSSVGSGRKERCPRSPRLGCVKKSSVDERTSSAHRLRSASCGFPEAAQGCWNFSFRRSWSTFPEPHQTKWFDGVFYLVSDLNVIGKKENGLASK